MRSAASSENALISPSQMAGYRPLRSSRLCPHSVGFWPIGRPWEATGLRRQTASGLSSSGGLPGMLTDSSTAEAVTSPHSRNARVGHPLATAI